MRRSERAKHRLIEIPKSLQANHQLQTGINLAAHGRTFDALRRLWPRTSPGRFRTRACAAANALHLRRRIDALLPAFLPPGIDVSSILDFVSAKPNSRSEHSNPTPAPIKTAATPWPPPGSPS